MAKRSEVTPRVLRQLLEYSPATGVLTWKERGRQWFETDKGWRVFNTRCSGKEAFTTVNAWGYRTGLVMKVPFLAHVCAWAIHHGEWPKQQIDHINRIAADNRIANLRDVSPEVNHWNRGLQENNTTGFKGVARKEGRFHARIGANGRRRHLGAFRTAREAAEAYNAAALKLHGKYAVLNEV